MKNEISYVSFSLGWFYKLSLLYFEAIFEVKV